MSDKPGNQPRFSLPPEAKVYRSIGPFDQTTLPKGRLREHQLKEGTWGRLRMLSGEIRFVWDDVGHEQEVLLAGEGATIVIPPNVPHHLELPAADFLLA